MEVLIQFRSYKRDIRELCSGIRLNSRPRTIVITFKSIALRGISKLRVTYDKTKLYRTAIAIVRVKIIIPTFVSNEILSVYRTSKPLVRVVIGVRNLDMVELCATSYRAQGQTIDFLILSEWITSKLNTHITQYTRVVCIVIASMLGAWSSFYFHFLLIVYSLSTEDDTTPISRLTIAFGLCRCKHNGCCRRAFSNEFSTSFGN